MFVLLLGWGGGGVGEVWGGQWGEVWGASNVAFASVYVRLERLAFSCCFLGWGVGRGFGRGLVPSGLWELNVFELFLDGGGGRGWGVSNVAFASSNPL